MQSTVQRVKELEEQVEQLRNVVPDSAPDSAPLRKLLKDSEVRAVSLTLNPMRSSVTVATTLNDGRYPWCLLSTESSPLQSFTPSDLQAELRALREATNASLEDAMP